MRESYFSKARNINEAALSGLLVFEQGEITEITGHYSSGKTAFVLSVLAKATNSSEFGAFIDPADSFDPLSAQKAGVKRDRLLWIRCPGNLDRALKSADYLLHAGGFGFVILDLSGIRPDLVSRIPKSYWYRYRLAMKNTRTIFLLVSPISCVGSSCSASLECKQEKIEWIGPAEHQLFKKIYSALVFRKKPKMLRAGYGAVVRQIPSAKMKISAFKR